MKLLFSTNKDTASEELRIALGFVDADIDITEITPDLRIATDKIIKIIGQAVYDDIITEYEKASDDVTKDKYLITAAQYAVGTSAYSLWAPLNDLAHTTNGRRMRSSDDQKTPFEWMMVRDDDKLQQRSYRAFDALLKFIDSKENYDVWLDSNEYKESHKLFVRTTEEFENHYQIHSRLLLTKLRPGLNKCEQFEIAPRIGAELFQLLKDKRNGTEATALTTVEKNLLALIQEACVFYSLSWGIPRLQINMFPEGILQSIRGERTTVRGRKTPEFMQVDQVEQLFKNDAAQVFNQIEDYIKEFYIDENVEPTVTDDDILDELGFGFDEDSLSVNT